MEKSLYRALHRMCRCFDREGIPLVGLIQDPISLRCWSPTETLKTQERWPGDRESHVDAGYSILQRLTAQLRILRQCPQESRQAFRFWHGLQKSCWDARQRTLGPADSLAIERAALSLHEHVQVQHGRSKDLEEPQLAVAGMNKELDLLARRIGEAPVWGQCQSPPEKLQAMSKILRHEEQFREAPYEWVYDGLRPLFIHDVLQSKKGMSASLAVIYCCVGRRLGLQLSALHLKADVQGPAGILRGFGSLATAPDTGDWLVHLDPGQGAGLFADPLMGTVMDAPTALRGFPALRNASALHNVAAGLAYSVPANGNTSTQGIQAAASWAGPHAVMHAWAGLVRVAMVAHQRRGDSDAVVHCLYQLLALDPGAPEWGVALQEPGVVA